MKRLLLIVIAAGLLLGAAAPVRADAKLKVVTTIPDLADLTRHVGGDFVDVSSIATGVEDIHAVPMKPSFAILLNRADALVLLGLEAEHAFLPGLIEASKNPKIAPNEQGYIDCSVSVSVLDVPARIDRALGDVHPMGNPHYNLDPVSMKEAARAIADGLGRLAPDHQADFKKNLDAYLAELDTNIARWEKEAAPLKGKKIVSYHPDLLYFADRFGMEAFGTIEIRAGVPPTPGHIEELETSMKQNKVDIVVRELHYPAGLAETVAQATGARLVELPAMVGGVPEAKDYISFVDYNLHTMLKAVQGG
jgi:ABC-type Zn uptake system ZnuABC Zn-binding protein ZnuA